MDSGTGGDAVQERMRGALLAAMKARDTTAVSALRSVLAAIGNAEAVAPRDVPPRDGGTAAASEHVAGGAAGLGASEARRRRLSLDETAGIVKDEISHRHDAARQYAAAGHAERADRLRHEAQAIQAALDGAGPP